MKHATDSALDKLEDLLQEIRRLGILKENKRGVFYLKSTAFLHFHEDPAGLFADLRIGKDFQRFSVSSLSQQKAFLRKVKDTGKQFINDKELGL